MFCIKGFHISASGAIQGHHGPLVHYTSSCSFSNNFLCSTNSICLVILNPFSNKPFLYVCTTSLLKMLWEKKKLLITSNFSFFHSVFYPLENRPPSLSNFILLSAISAHQRGSRSCIPSHCWVVISDVQFHVTLTLSQTTNFGLFQIERVCR